MTEPEQNPGVNNGEGPMTPPPSKKCALNNCLCDFGGNAMAKGIAALGSARGSVIMTNLFLSTALIGLAENHLDIQCKNMGITNPDECPTKIYGFKPSSLIANISVITGIISAFLMPIVGAILDFTSWRRITGRISALLMTLIQIIQIGTLPATWFPMAILQAIAGFFYNIQVLATFSYFPELAREVGETLMTRYTSNFTMLQFGTHASFLVLMVGLGMGLGLNDLQTAQISQAVDSLWLGVFFSYAWYILPAVPPRHSLPAGSNIMTVGFKQIWYTMKGIHKHYSHGLQWFLFAVTFAAAGANAFTVVSVTYMVEVLKMNGTEIGIVFLITLISTVVGAKIGFMITKKTNPKISWIICLYTFSAITFASCFVLISPEMKNAVWGFAVLWGLVLGWFYPTENVIFSFALPKGQEAELTGFFIYCTQIITWLPPLIFTIVNEAGISMRWAMMSLLIFFGMGILFLHIMQPWDELVEAANKQNRLSIYQDGDESRPPRHEDIENQKHDIDTDNGFQMTPANYPK